MDTPETTQRHDQGRHRSTEPLWGKDQIRDYLGGCSWEVIVELHGRGLPLWMIRGTYMTSRTAVDRFFAAMETDDPLLADDRIPLVD